jgi:hypothetical protein
VPGPFKYQREKGSQSSEFIHFHIIPVLRK